MTRKEFDLVVFGASGYTGKFVVRELLEQIKSSSIGSLSWAIAGRSKDKLAATLSSVAIELNLGNIDVATIEADVKNEPSIKSMCERTRLVVNCVGPYRFFGETVVKHCVENGTHHLDVSGEPEYLENMQLKYGAKAAERGVCVVGSCGFDSVPADIGFLFTKNNFKYDLNHIESYLTLDFGKAPASFNYATWESAVYGFASAANLLKIRKQLFPTRLPRSIYPTPKKQNALGFFYDETLKKYCFPFMGSDKSVVQRTQYFLWENKNQRPISYSPYFTIQRMLHVLMFVFWAILFSTLANFKFGRYLLLKYYSLFSFGCASKKETTYNQMSSSRFYMQFRGYGFDHKLENGEVAGDKSKIVGEPNQQIVTEVTGPEPGYISTAKIILACSLSLLERDEKSKLPLRGGVFTPGAIFSDINDLLERLAKGGIEFRVLRNDSLKPSSL